jgi:hypothetical protein
MSASYFVRRGCSRRLWRLAGRQLSEALALRGRRYQREISGQPERPISTRGLPGIGGAWFAAEEGETSGRLRPTVNAFHQAWRSRSSGPRGGGIEPAGRRSSFRGDAPGPIRRSCLGLPSAATVAVFAAAPYARTVARINRRRRRGVNARVGGRGGKAGHLKGASAPRATRGLHR